MADEVDWERIHGFRSLADYDRFVQWVEARIHEGSVVEVPVTDRYSSANFTERWIRGEGSDRVWRIVEPEPPFRGVFLPIDDG